MIVIHIDTQQDTSFLKKTYEGISNLILLYNPTKDEVNKTLEENPNEDVMMLGHGSPSGLFSHDWKGFVIDYTNAHLLKGRNCIGIWCWAKKFAKNYGLKGYFTSLKKWCSSPSPSTPSSLTTFPMRSGSANCKPSLI